MCIQFATLQCEVPSTLMFMKVVPNYQGLDVYEGSTKLPGLDVYEVSTKLPGAQYLRCSPNYYYS